MTARTRGLVIVVVVLTLATLSGPFMLGGMMGPGWMGTDSGGHHPGMMWGLGGLTMLAFWALIVIGVVLLVRWLDENRPSERAPRELPEEILRRRYAAGELTREQFEQMQRDLEGRKT